MVHKFSGQSPNIVIIYTRRYQNLAQDYECMSLECELAKTWAGKVTVSV